MGSLDPCTMHDCRNALKWSVFAYWQDGELMKDLFIVCESLRNAADLVFERMPHWLADKVSHVRSQSFCIFAQLEALWTSCWFSCITILLFGAQRKLEMKRWWLWW